VSRPINLSRDQILAHRRLVNGLETKLPYSADSLRRAAYVGLQDSMPRAALLSIHARVAGATPDSWADEPLVQVWGPRYSAFVVAREDVPYFTLSRLPDDPKGRRRAEETAERMAAHFGDQRLNYELAGDEMGVNPNSLRYAAPTGRVLIRWEGARRPLAWMVPAPDVDPFDARLEAARRFLHVFGPSTAASFADWLGLSGRDAQRAFEALEPELMTVNTPIGERVILAADQGSLEASVTPATSVRLLPSGDSFYLFWGTDRELMVPDTRRRGELWTSRVWPGALLVGPEIVGVWRRDKHKVDIDLWRSLTDDEVAAAEREAASLPLPGLSDSVRVSWNVLE
jgi:hypothetical protein